MSHTLQITGAATAELHVGAATPITVIGTDPIRESFGAKTLQQAVNSRNAPGVVDVVLNPDAHVGYGAPVGSVLVSPSHIYPGPVGVDIKCSMSLLQLDLPADQIVDRATRRAIIKAIAERTPTGPGKGQRNAKKSRRSGPFLGRSAVVSGASASVCEQFGIPTHWATRCEDAFHRGHDGTEDALAQRLDVHTKEKRYERLASKFAQLGSYGGGNHFGECEVVEAIDEAMTHAFGMTPNAVAFLSHCGSRGFGHDLAAHQFKTMNLAFAKTGRALPAGDRQLVYAELDTPEANDYLDDMALGANFATVNHLLINALVLEAFQEVIPGVKGDLVYFISHNIARKEPYRNTEAWVHRKGATRAFPAGHPSLVGTPFQDIGHPILLPGNPRDGSMVMVAEAGAETSAHSVNHGAGRAMSRTAAKKNLDQQTVDAELDQYDIMSNTRRYPLDEAPDAYKDFNEVLSSVEQAGLARHVARLNARFVIKDGAPADD